MVTQLVLFDYSDSEEEEIIIDEKTKICRLCEIEKSIEDFYLDRGAVYSKCKQCCKIESKILARIKKTAPSKPKNKKCECCYKLVDRWYCDHWHTTETFRGWVCFPCNQGIGFLDDNIIGVFRALVYLIRKSIVSFFRDNKLNELQFFQRNKKASRRKQNDI